MDKQMLKRFALHVNKSDLVAALILGAFVWLAMEPVVHAIIKR